MVIMRFQKSGYGGQGGGQSGGSSGGGGKGGGVGASTSSPSPGTTRPNPPQRSTKG